MTDLFLLSMLISLCGGIIFILSGIVNFIKSRPSRVEWKRALTFIGLAIAFFVLFGLSL